MVFLFLACMLKQLHPGKESSSSVSSSGTDVNQITPQEKQKIMGLTVRDLRLGSTPTMLELKPRQLAYALAGTCPWVLPSDLLEAGGELDSGLPESVVALNLCLQLSASIQFGLNDCRCCECVHKLVSKLIAWFDSFFCWSFAVSSHLRTVCYSRRLRIARRNVMRRGRQTPWPRPS